MIYKCQKCYNIKRNIYHISQFTKGLIITLTFVQNHFALYTPKHRSALDIGFANVW